MIQYANVITNENEIEREHVNWNGYAKVIKFKIKYDHR